MTLRELGDNINEMFNTLFNSVLDVEISLIFHFIISIIALSIFCCAVKCFFSWIFSDTLTQLKQKEDEEVLEYADEEALGYLDTSTEH